MAPALGLILPREPGVAKRKLLIVRLQVLLLIAFTLLLLAVFAGKAVPRGWDLLSFVCHQRPDRSFFVLGHQLGACCRCTGVYLGFWQILLLASLRRHPRDQPIVRSLFFGLALLIPMAVDLVGKVAFGFSTPSLLRFLLALIYGAGCGLLVQPLEEILARTEERPRTASLSGIAGAIRVNADTLPKGGCT